MGRGLHPRPVACCGSGRPRAGRPHRRSASTGPGAGTDAHADAGARGRRAVHRPARRPATGRSTSTPVSAASASRTPSTPTPIPIPRATWATTGPRASSSRRISASFDVGKSELYGKFSVVGERTFAAPPSLVGEDASSFKIEDALPRLALGERRRETENLLDFTVGRTQYKIGHGMLLWDGGGEGGSRGGFWSNARKAWQFAAVGRLKPENHTLEAFYLDRDEVPESETGTRLWGGNYELALGETTTLGADLPQVLRRQGQEAQPRRDERLQRASLHRALQEPAGPLLRAGVRPRGERRPAASPMPGRRRRPTSWATWPGSPGSPTATPSSRATIPRPRRTRPSTRSCPASTTGAPGGRARSPASTSSPTPTSSRTRCAST